MEQQPNFYGGTSGLTMPVKNKQAFPPEYQDKTRLQYYASLFNSIEINSSFYKLPIGKTVAKWADSVPDDFRFTYKMLRDITHNKELAYNPDDIHRFMASINHVGDKKGSLLIQFPASITIDRMPQMQRLLYDISQADVAGWDIAVELRSKTWYTEDVFRLLDEVQMGMVLHDMPASAAPLQDTEVDFVYLRFHGPGGGYRGSYEDDFLSEYASYIRDWQADGKRVYAYFNNTMGAAVFNLMTLNDMLRAEL